MTEMMKTNEYGTTSFLKRYKCYAII